MKILKIENHKMVIFSEFFPVEAERISAYVEQALCGGNKTFEESSLNLPVQSIYRISRKRSMSNMISNAKEDSEKTIHESTDTNEKISDIHDLLENFDNLDFSTGYESCNQIEIKITASESILSLNNEISHLSLDEFSSIVPPNSRHEDTKPLTKKSVFTLSSVGEKKSKISQSKLSLPKIKRDHAPHPTIQRILEEAKTKRKKSQPEIKIPVVDLKFF